MNLFTRWFKVSVVASAMAAGAVSAQDGRPRIVETEYDNVSPGKLISVFKKAYGAEGFKLREERTRVTNGGTENATRLVFEMSNPEHPRKKKGTVSFQIRSQRGPSRCAPCLAHAETLGVTDASEYDGKAYLDFLSRIIEADRSARATIRAELGRSPRPEKSLKWGGI